MYSILKVLGTEWTHLDSEEDGSGHLVKRTGVIWRVNIYTWSPTKATKSVMQQIQTQSLSAL